MAANEPLKVVAKNRADAWLKELDKNGDGKIGNDECGTQFRDEQSCQIAIKNLSRRILISLPAAEQQLFAR